MGGGGTSKLQYDGGQFAGGKFYESDGVCEGDGEE